MPLRSGLQPPGGRDIFFSHHTIRLNGSIPGRNMGQWAQMDTTCLPVTVVVKVPRNVRGYFSLKCTVENKFNGVVIYKSSGTLYLDTGNMRNGFKIVSLR